MKFFTFVSKLLTFLLAISILVIILPLILITSVPFYLLRTFVKNLAKCVKPKNFGKMVTCRGTPFTIDDFSRPKATVSIAILLEGNVDVPGARRLIEKRLFEEARYPNGDFKFPELKQYMSGWMGYYFWKDDTNFDIKNHIKIHPKCTSSESDHFTQKDIDEFREEVFNLEWPKKRTLWDITFIPNCYPNDPEGVTVGVPLPHTLMILRHHHSIGDGFSWLPLLIRNICKADIKFPEPNYVHRPFLSQLLYGIAFPFRMAYELADIAIFAFNSMGTTPFKVRESKADWKHLIQTTRKISMQKLKEIRAYFKVSFSSVVHSIIGGAMRDFLTLKGLPVPTKLQAGTPQPLPDHTDKLRNYLSGTLIHFPTGISDPVQRLKFSHQDLENGKQSTIPKLFQFLYLLLGVFPSFLIRHLVSNFAITTGISNFAGSSKPISFHGVSEHKWIEHSFAVGLQIGSAGLIFLSVSYVDDFRITSTCHSSIMTKSDLRQLTNLIEKNFEILHKLAVMNDV